MRKAITQHEARQLRARVKHLERIVQMRRKDWSGDWPGTFLDSFDAEERIATVIRTASKLNHACIVRMSDDGLSVLIFAEPLAEQKP